MLNQFISLCRIKNYENIASQLCRAIVLHILLFFFKNEDLLFLGFFFYFLFLKIKNNIFFFIKYKGLFRRCF